MINKNKIALFSLAVILLLGAGFFIYYTKYRHQSPQTEMVTSSLEPQKTEFGDTLPTDFPINIPVEESAKKEQSYSLDYQGQKQLTIVFSSTKSMKDNDDFYQDFFKKEGWNIANRFQNDSISSLYATKDKDEINITINKSTDTTSSVSISILKK